MSYKITGLYFPFWFLAFILLIGLTLPILLQDGMFMDAEQYTCVSHNLSQGIGSFWFPQFSLKNMYNMSSFHEQPPLVFGLQALFFKVLGDSMYTERFYTFLTMCLTTYLINLLWKESCKDETKKMGWLPIILWITVPVCFWSYSNNMHENTMGFFTLASGLFAFKALRSEKFKLYQFVLSGLFVFLASFSKGMPGLFTLSMPFIYWLVTQKISAGKMIAATVAMVAAPLILYGFLLMMQDSRESLLMYFKRLTDRVNDDPTVTSRFHIIGDLFSELLPVLIFLAVVVLITGIKKAKAVWKENDNSIALFFILTGLAGAIPLMLTMVQRGFYLVPAFPFLSVGIGLIIAPLLAKPISAINITGNGFKVFRLITITAFIFAFVFSILQVGKVSRDKDELHDIYTIGKIVPKYSAMTVARNTWNEWSLQCYLMRYFNISLDSDVDYKYFLVDTKIPATAPPGYNKLSVGLIRYELYEKQ